MGGVKRAGRTEPSLFFRGKSGHEPNKKLPPPEGCIGKAVLESLGELTFRDPRKGQGGLRWSGRRV